RSGRSVVQTAGHGAALDRVFGVVQDVHAGCRVAAHRTRRLQEPRLVPDANSSTRAVLVERQGHATVAGPYHLARVGANRRRIDWHELAVPAVFEQSEFWAPQRVTHDLRCGRYAVQLKVDGERCWQAARDVDWLLAELPQHRARRGGCMLQLV